MSLSMSLNAIQANEYLQGIPVQHLFQQQKVNAELWHWWNLIDHERVIGGTGWTYYSPEKTICSPGVEFINGSDPPALSMCYSICSRRWRQEQEHHIDARIGEIFFAKNGTGSWDTHIHITYALERVDTPFRWNKYCVYHLPSESFVDVIKQHTQ